MALGKRWFASGFWLGRFKKCWCAFSTSSWALAKAHRLDQNWQSLASKAQHSNHWGKNANLRLTCQGVNHDHCGYKLDSEVWLQKKFTTRKTCWIAVWLPANSGIWNPYSIVTRRYVRHISGICLTYSKFLHMSGIYLEYTSMPKARISLVSMHVSIP